MFIADYHDEPIAVAMIVISNGSAFYHHGASTQKFPKITASYLLRWQAIQYAQLRGCRYYNFWGISPVDKPKHPWAGLSLFKQGFGGFSEAYMHAQDYPLKSKYWLNLAIECARRIKRGL